MFILIPPFRHTFINGCNAEQGGVFLQVVVATKAEQQALKGTVC